jgi:hypothetical protein
MKMSDNKYSAIIGLEFGVNRRHLSSSPPHLVHQGGESAPLLFTEEKNSRPRSDAASSANKYYMTRVLNFSHALLCLLGCTETSEESHYSFS